MLQRDAVELAARLASVELKDVVDPRLTVVGSILSHTRHDIAARKHVQLGASSLAGRSSSGGSGGEGPVQRGSGGGSRGDGGSVDDGGGGGRRGNAGGGESGSSCGWYGDSEEQKKHFDSVVAADDPEIVILEDAAGMASVPGELHYLSTLVPLVVVCGST